MWKYREGTVLKMHRCYGLNMPPHRIYRLKSNPQRTRHWVYPWYTLHGCPESDKISIKWTCNWLCQKSSCPTSCPHLEVTALLTLNSLKYIEFGSLVIFRRLSYMLVICPCSHLTPQLDCQPFRQVQTQCPGDVKVPLVTRVRVLQKLT